MIIKSILRNAWNSMNIRGTLSEKILAFIASIRLMIKSKMYSKTNSKVNANFLNYRFYAYDYQVIEFLFNEVFLTNEYYFKSTKTEPLIIDCGANIGMSILYFKKMYPHSKIIAFEANPYAFMLLEENIKTNNIKNVEIHNIALFDRQTEIPFFIGDNIGTLLGSIKKERGGNSELLVKAERLSDFLKNIDSVDLIKIDVEGAEVNIISDLFDSSTINKANEYIIEYHHNMNDEKSNLSSFLQKFELNGFNYNIKTSFRDLNSFQDILIHFYK